MKRGSCKSQIFFIFTISVLLCVWSLHRTDGFSLDKIQGRLVYGENRSAPSGLFSSSYHYLAKGRQCFVFISDDGKRVLKFLNYNRFFFPEWLLSAPLPLQLKKYGEKRRARYQKTVDSFTLAETYLAKETGIEYLHLRQGGSLPSVQLIGPGGRVRTIDLNSVAFILQKRADCPIFDKLDRLEGEEGLAVAIESIVALLHKRCALGIADDDRDIEINFGFAGDEPLLIDPGRLFLNDDLKTKEGKLSEMRAATKKLRRRYPSAFQE